MYTWGRNQKTDFIFLQETRSEHETERQREREEEEVRRVFAITETDIF